MDKTEFENLPKNAKDFIALVIKKMRYRKKIRAEVLDELAAHFAEELRDCQTEEQKQQKAEQLINQFGDPKLLAKLLRRAKKRCRPLWRNIFAYLFGTFRVVIICLLIYILWFVSGRPDPSINYVAQLNQAIRPPASDSLNAAPYIDKALELWVKDPTGYDGLKPALSSWPERVTEEENEQLEKWIKENEPCFEQIILASKKPYYWRQYKADANDLWVLQIPDLQEYQPMSILLALRAKMNAKKGRFDSAFNDIEACYNFGRLLIRSGLPVEQIVGLRIEFLSLRAALEIVDSQQLNSDQLAALQKKLELASAGQDFTLNLLGERLSVYDRIQRSFTSDRIGGGHIYPKAVLGDSGKGKEVNSLTYLPKLLFFHPNKKETYAAAKQFYDYYDSMAAKTPYEILSEHISVQAEAREIVKGNILLEWLCGGFSRLGRDYHNLRAETQSTIAVLAILRYQKDTGVLPDSIEQLKSAGYIQDVPLDPYSDEPVVYRKNGSRFTLYSVGVGFSDDGGVIYQTSGYIWANPPGTDVVFWPVQK